MKNIGALLTLAAIVLVSQTACEKKTVTPKLTHWDAVRTLISENPDVFRLGFYDTTPTDTLFYREITQSDGDIEQGILVEEDTAHSGPGPFFPYITLTWGDSLKGSFHYRYDGAWREKPIRSAALTQGYFQRWGDDYDPNLGWILKGFGGTVINSVGSTRQPSILSIVSSGVDVTLSEPLLRKWANKDSTLVFGRGQLVALTVEPSSGTADYLFLHLREFDSYEKIPFTDNGDGTLSASWTTTGSPDPNKRYYHAIVDIVSRASVTDTLAKYDSKAWGIIYRIQ